jgi:hypothetical protein
MNAARVCVAFSTHRLETLPGAEARMRAHEAVVLEEPPEPAFADMLAGRLPIDDYLEELELEFPVFARASAELLRALAADGIEIRQIDPYMEVLLSIHDLFDNGGRPGDIAAESLMGRVYAMERRWTGALIGFYARSSSLDFDRVVAGVQEFARTDARRGLLRDRLRAAEIVERTARFRSLYVEAGTLHLPLFAELRARLGNAAEVRPVWLMEPVWRQLAKRRQILGPGDELTLRYAFRPGFSGPRADLLAARSLIHVKLLEKDEVSSSSEPYPHTRDEFETAEIVSRLSHADCRRLYPRVRAVSREAAREVVDTDLPASR